jgi:hypothetical protein
VAFLSDTTIHRLVKAACEIALDAEALLETLPSQVRSALGSRSAPASQFLVVFTKLNSWQPRGGEEPPLCTFLRNAEFLCADRLEAEVFEEALTEVEQRRRSDVRPSSRLLQDLLMRRAKRYYTSHGYEVMPPETEPSATFLAYRGVSVLSVVAVADETVEEAISAVTQLVREVRPNEPLAEGYVVLTSRTPDKLKSDEAKVRGANLRPVTYTDLPPMGLPEIETFVLRQHAWILTEPDPPDLCDGDMSRESLEGLLRDLLSDRDARVLVLQMGNLRAVWHARRRIVHACSEVHANKPDAPAPIVLPLAERPPSDIKDVVAEVFRLHGVRFNPLALQQMLENGALLPIFTTEAPWSAAFTLVRQAVVGNAKAVLLLCEEEATTSMPSLVRRLNVPVTGIRVVMA